MKLHSKKIWIAAALVPLAFAGACSSTSGSGTPTAPAKFYVSLGDSYSVGYQPDIGATTGFTGVVATKTGMTLKNFGCAGATTTSVLQTIGCPDVLPRTAGAVAYPATTQIAAAQAFLKAHQGQIGLITVAIGGNDVTACAKDPNPIPCVGAADRSITTNVTNLVASLRTAAGPSVPIIGITYPDVILGSYVYPSQPASAAQMSLAQLSVTAFKTQINPALEAAYASGNGSFVDVTSATGAYGPLTETTTLAPYGSIPVPVAKICTLTWFCSKGDIHAKTPGYDLIGQLVANQYRTASKG